MGIKEVMKRIFSPGEDTKEDTAEVSNLEPVRIYIKQQLREKGLKNNQIEIDFSNVCTKEEVVKVAEELGFNLERGEKEGVWWLFR
ncbi:hypothetical protein [Clostridium sp. HMP27]|uniref:hypothetical protein n=1 Tax=Clostridium sp. HMP27 TaxID=1487921 RepID=UPI00052BA67E|nr:hypothetical protein [Clostridium sp. HMP27]KGK86470.1 hypothetical protein DP68_13825 [Clostridium sp. HMP27]